MSKIDLQDMIADARTQAEWLSRAACAWDPKRCEMDARALAGLEQALEDLADRLRRAEEALQKAS